MSMNPVDTLLDPQVRAYFLGILNSSLSNEAKYERFIAFFKKEMEIREMISAREDAVPQGHVKRQSLEDALVSTIDEMNLLNTQAMKRDVEWSILRATQRLGRSQHFDGGWGPRDRSEFWETAFSAMCLKAVGDLDDPFFAGIARQDILAKALDWLALHTDAWSYEQFGDNELVPVYNLSLAILLYRFVTEQNFSSTFQAKIEAGVVRLARAKCADGGWRARSWDQKGEESIFDCSSEVGATSFAVRALACMSPETYRSEIASGIEWLRTRQCPDGYWTDEWQLNAASIPKTCDALQGLDEGLKNGIGAAADNDSIERGVNWLKEQETPVFRGGVISGWGWDYIPIEIEPSVFGDDIVKRLPEEDIEFLRTVYCFNYQRNTYTFVPNVPDDKKNRTMAILERAGYDYDYVATCLTLETLVKLSSQEVFLLASNVQWLISNQYKNDMSDEDGKWGRNTARILFSLVYYYNKLCASVV